MSAYYAAPGDPATAAGQEELAPVLVAFAGPAPQSRLTVLIRLLMVIPHLFVLWALAIAAYVVVIIGWFGALFTGRLPTFAADYLAGFVRWQARVFGYAILLTDVYPPFTLEDVDYPIRVAVRPGRLNRLAVLFRLVLLIPAWIVQAVVGYGAFTLFQFVNWLIVLVRGRMPDSLYQALAAALRYQARVIGFAFMLTSAYPSGLYGDPVTAGTAGPQPGFGTQPWYWPQPGYGTPPATGAAWWWLILSGGAKKLMTAFIVLGVLIAAGTGFVRGTYSLSFTFSLKSNAVNSAGTINTLNADGVPVSSAINNYSANLQACHNQVACVNRLDRHVASIISTFARQVRSTAVPPGQASADAATLVWSASRVASIFASLGAATSAAQYNSIFEASGLQQAIGEMRQDALNLGNALRGN